MWDDVDDERKREGETRCRLIACTSRKAPRVPLGLTSPSDGRISTNSAICLLNIHTAEGFGIWSRTMMYNLAIRVCTSPPLLAPRLKIFKLKCTTPPWIESRTCWTRGRHATIWASAARLDVDCTFSGPRNETDSRVNGLLYFVHPGGEMGRFLMEMKLLNMHSVASSKSHGI